MTAIRPADVPRPARCAHLRTDSRGYPVIATVGQAPGEVDFGSLSEKRKLALATFDLCAVCALPFHNELRWLVTFEHTNDVRISNEAPVHEICGLFSAQICPFVSSPYARLSDEQRRGQRRAEFVVLSGFRFTKRVFGHASPLQSDSVLHFEMSGLSRKHVLKNRDDAVRAYEAALAAEQPIELDPQERTLVELMCNPTAEENEDSGGVMAGAAWFTGAAFCPGVRTVQGMSYYVDGKSYDKLAAQVLVSPKFRREFAESNDPATRAAMQWLITRTRLPTVLASWHHEGRQRVQVVRPSGPTPTDRKKAKRKSQAAARRKHRR